MYCKHSVAWAAILCLVFATSESRANEPETRIHANLETARDVVIQLGTQIQHTQLDCSHFVHALYDEAGLHYRYATAIRLYRGLERFQRVSQPQPGDLVVWPTHVGIVVAPERHAFLSAIASGVKMSSYRSHYWTKKGSARFLRYTQLEIEREPSQAAQTQVGG